MSDAMGARFHAMQGGPSGPGAELHRLERRRRISPIVGMSMSEQPNGATCFARYRMTCLVRLSLDWKTGANCF
eukprot:8469080-Pyramimonas_sp.AAC.1